MECPYCSLKESDQNVVFRDDLVWFVEDHRYQGALKHSGVIIPVAHRETVFDLTESEVAAMFRLLQRVKAWMDAEFSPDGNNVGWNCGRVGGQEVFHAHLHVIPRHHRTTRRARAPLSLMKSSWRRRFRTRSLSASTSTSSWCK
jgi:histidine triad (HIT) family protein